MLTVLVAAGSVAQNSSTATQTIRLEVQPVAALAVSGSPGPLVITTGTPGVSTQMVEDRSTTYDLSTNRTALKISASMNEPLPSGMRLLVQLASTRGQSAGSVELSGAGAPVNVVTGIDKGRDLAQPIVYTFVVDAASGTLASQNRTVVLTLTD